MASLADSLTNLIRDSWKSAADAVRAAPRAAGDPPDEAALIKRATEGAAARQFLESPIVQDFMSRCEAKLIDKLTSAELKDDDGRMRMAVAVQTVRQLRAFLTATTQDGRQAEQELERLAKGDKRGFF